MARWPRSSAKNGWRAQFMHWNGESVQSGRSCEQAPSRGVGWLKWERCVCRLRPLAGRSLPFSSKTRGVAECTLNIFGAPCGTKRCRCPRALASGCCLDTGWVYPVLGLWRRLNSIGQSTPALAVVNHIASRPHVGDTTGRTAGNSRARGSAPDRWPRIACPALCSKLEYEPANLS